MRAWASALLLTGALALPVTGQTVPTDEVSEQTYMREKVEDMLRYFKREKSFVSIESICATACEHSHNTIYNQRWKECLLDAQVQLQEYRGATLANHTMLDPETLFTHLALLNGHLEFVEKHLQEYHSQNPQEENKSAKK